MNIPFVRELEFEYGVADRLSPLVRRVVAKNPSPFTYYGTGTYVIGNGEVAVIDPGPDLASHVDALEDALAGETLTHILVTHTHRDHSPAARLLQHRLGGLIHAFGPHGSGRPEAAGAVEEGADHDFAPDIKLRDGDTVGGADWTLEAFHTPGHCSNHLCYRLGEERTLFTGDHVMGWSTTVVAPPDGDMQAYMHSLRRLLEADDAIYWPTHGPAIRNPRAFVHAYIAHREAREAQILDCLRAGQHTIEQMVERMYAEVDPRLHPAAARSVLSHLIHLVETGRAVSTGVPSLGTTYGLSA
jgi:glyoxylase-like metal-dependent hydrolase (beta-lactamase superfamily II)